MSKSQVLLVFAVLSTAKQGRFQEINERLSFTKEEKVRRRPCTTTSHSPLCPRKAYLKAIMFCNNARKREVIINTLNLSIR